MIIVKVWGGLGNQMFDYALYRQLEEKYRGEIEVKLDISFFDYYDAHYGYELERVFSLKPVYATREECEKLANIKLDMWNRFKRKYICQKPTQIVPAPEQATCFVPEILELSEGYLQGYWQSELYFKNIENEIRKDFRFCNPLNKNNSELLEQIRASNSVSLHVRRGDYVSNQKIKKDALTPSGVCTEKYYFNAIEYIQAQIENPEFFVFSDDIEWCRQNLRLESAHYADWNVGKESFVDMQLMSCCKHNIISNSTFSWWGAWLNGNPGKMVLVPDKWYYNGHIGDILCDDWRKIKTT